MAAPLIAIVGKLFTKKRLQQMALNRAIKKMFQRTPDPDIPISNITKGKVKATGEPINFPSPLFNNKFFKKLGDNLVNQYRHHIFNKSNPKDAYGNPFKQPYSKGYEKSKKSGRMRRQDSSYAGSYAPYLTGDLSRDLGHSVDAKRNTIYLGWNAHANKIDWLKKNGRVLTDGNYPLPKSVVDKAMKIMNNELKKTMPKGKHKIKITAKVSSGISQKTKK
jgi:hypothetical protein|tara:strand:+ start:742 stop:1401 length:660 start_codon:yes stop_codon:yes gene_type:complete